MSGAHAQQQQMQAQETRQQLSGNGGLFARPVAGFTVYEETRTPGGIAYRPMTMAQFVSENRLRVVP